MLDLHKIRELTLEPGAPSDRAPHLSAASGLVRVGNRLYVVADDEQHLGVFSLAQKTPGELIRLLPGDLPEDKGDRKALKADFETLLRLPPMADCPDGALLAIGSGSRRNRRVGVLLALDRAGAIRGAARTIDLAPMMQQAKQLLENVNIEGTVVAGEQLLLLQRGNKGAGRNALLSMPLAAVLRALERGEAVEGLLEVIADGLDLGNIDGVPLCFSDAAALPDGDLVFTAIAEDSDDSYADGGCLGAAIGVISSAGRIRRLERIAQVCKPEGIEARVEGERLHLLLVTDADDPRIPATLYSAVIDGYPFSANR